MNDLKIIYKHANREKAALSTASLGKIHTAPSEIVGSKEKLPYSDRPATVDNVNQQLIRPALVMPSFTKLTDQEMSDLIVYLKTL